MKARRLHTPDAAQATVAALSERRCCLCWKLNGLDEPVKGQIAHLDGNPAKNDLANLVWLCLSHHDDYDSKTSQSKGLMEMEVRRYRDALHEMVRNRDHQHVSANPKDTVMRDAMASTYELLAKALQMLESLLQPGLAGSLDTRRKQAVDSFNVFSEAFSRNRLHFSADAIDAVEELTRCAQGYDLALANRNVPNARRWMKKVEDTRREFEQIVRESRSSATPVGTVQSDNAYIAGRDMTFVVTQHNRPSRPPILPGSMAEDRRKYNYLNYLVERYHTFKAWDCDRQGIKMDHLRIHVAFKREFGMPIRHAPVERFDEAAEFLHRYIRQTKLARIKAKEGNRLYESFQEYQG